MKAGPGSAVAPVHYRVRYDSRLLHIGLGARHRGEPIVLLNDLPRHRLRCSEMSTMS